MSTSLPQKRRISSQETDMNNLERYDRFGHDKETEQRKIRRQIANNNERRRMQSINAGFECLRTMLPLVDEKMSKAGILQRTKDYLCRLQQERLALIKENDRIRSAISSEESTLDDDNSKRLKRCRLEIELENEKRKRKDLEEENRRLKERLAQPSSKQRVEEVDKVDGSMSHRNIQTIIAAIKHLEGDKLFEECDKKLSNSVTTNGSEESEASSSEEAEFSCEEYDATLSLSVFHAPSASMRS